MKKPLFLIYLVALITFSLTLYLSISILIDPYGIWHSNSIAGLNKYKTKIDVQLLLHKKYQVLKKKPESIMIGSSTTLLGFNLDEVDYFNEKKSYNLGVGSLRMSNAFEYLELVTSKNNNLNEIFLSLDILYFFEENNPLVNYEKFKNIKSNNYQFTIERLKVVFTKSNALHTFLTMYENFFQTKNSSYIRNDGSIDTAQMHNFMFKDKSVKTRSDIISTSVESYFNHMKYFPESEHLIKIDQKQVDALRKFIIFCELNNIRLYIFIAPIHAIGIENFFVNNIDQEVSYLKKIISSNHKIYDFFHYNKISMTDFKNNKNFLDLEHFRENIGALIIDQITNKEKKDRLKEYIILENTDDFIKYDINSKKRIDWKNSIIANELIKKNVKNFYE